MTILRSKLGASQTLAKSMERPPLSLQKKIISPNRSTLDIGMLEGSQSQRLGNRLPKTSQMKRQFRAKNSLQGVSLPQIPPGGRNVSSMSTNNQRAQALYNNLSKSSNNNRRSMQVSKDRYKMNSIAKSGSAINLQAAETYEQLEKHRVNRISSTRDDGARANNNTVQGYADMRLKMASKRSPYKEDDEESLPSEVDM